MSSKIFHYPSEVASTGLSENEYCRRLKTSYGFTFPNFDELICGLRANIEVIEEWLNYSEDRRATSTYYFRKNGRTFEVGYLSRSGVEKIGNYDDACLACALFIKLEMEHRFLKLSF